MTLQMDQQPLPQPAHAHHWVIAPVATGGSFAAACKGCDAVRTFPVSDTYNWEERGSLLFGRQHAKRSSKAEGPLLSDEQEYSWQED